MSTKTIAIDTEVYNALATLKQGSESFSKLLNRLANQPSGAKTGVDILAHLEESTLPSLTRYESQIMEDLVGQNRRAEKWELHNLS